MATKKIISRIVLGMIGMATVTGQCNASQMFSNEELLSMIDPDLLVVNEEEELSKLKRELGLPENATEANLIYALKKNLNCSFMQLSLKKLREAKMNVNMLGCQLIVEGPEIQEDYDIINDELYAYLKTYYTNYNELKNSRFLYTLLRMLIDHPNKLDEKIKKCLPLILGVLGKEYVTGNFRDAGLKIYDWMYENMEGALGEYHPCY